MYEKVIASLRFSLDILKTGSSRQQAKAKNKLDKLAAKFPDEAAEVGYEADPLKVVRVWSFHCMAAPRVSQEGFEDAVEKQMRLREQFFNELVHSTRPLYKKYMKLFAKSSAQAQMIELKSQSKKLNSEIVAFIKTNHAKKVKDGGKGRHITPEIVELRQQVRTINAALNVLRPQVREERFAANSNEEKRKLDTTMYSLQKKLRQKFAKLGLRQPNYNAVLQDFTVAFKSALKSTEAHEIRLKFHYELRDEPNTLPPDIMTWEAWDRCGKFSIAVTTPDDPNKNFSTVLEGKNTQFQVRPITEQEWLAFGSRQKLDFTKEKTSRVHLARIRVDSFGKRKQAVFAEVPVMLHRDFPEDAELCSASIITRKIAGRLERELQVSVGFPGKSPRKTGASARVEIKLDVERKSFATLTRTNNKAFKEWVAAPENPCGRILNSSEVLIDPELIKVENFCQNLYSHVSEHFKRASAEIDALGSLAMPVWFTKSNCHTKSARGISRVFRTWRAGIISAQKTEEGKLEVRAFLKGLREISRNGIKDDWESTAEEVAYEIGERLGTKAKMSRFLAISLMFAERADHLGSWADNLARKARRRRKNNYRVIASRFLTGVKSIEIPKVHLQTRNMTEEQRAAGITEFIEALKNYAQRESIQIIQYVPEQLAKAA
jgi:hypothetical protein